MRRCAAGGGASSPWVGSRWRSSTESPCGPTTACAASPGPQSHMSSRYSIVLSSWACSLLTGNGLAVVELILNVRRVCWGGAGVCWGGVRNSTQGALCALNLELELGRSHPTPNRLRGVPRCLWPESGRPAGGARVVARACGARHHHPRRQCCGQGQTPYERLRADPWRSVRRARRAPRALRNWPPHR